eukprot:TRINITY_DN54378_c0_g1_i2.p3 TRINITY_DN54378_c0_g1~~TRINITY_DN54378_c0_g1_i2.p3  ORF type:complete len:117 (-),score=13.22 TRINITY_DN54378_c0_g1_i2:209-559(-)
MCTFFFLFFVVRRRHFLLVSQAYFCFLCFFFNDTATTEIYTRSIVGSVRCVQETVCNRGLIFYEEKDFLSSPVLVDLLNMVPFYSVLQQASCYTEKLEKVSHYLENLGYEKEWFPT